LSAEWIGRRRALQERVTALLPPLPESPDALFKAIRQHLWQAADEGALKTPPQTILKLLKRTSEGQPRGHVAITGGEWKEAARPPRILTPRPEPLERRLQVHEALPDPLERLLQPLTPPRTLSALLVARQAPSEPLFDASFKTKPLLRSCALVYVPVQNERGLSCLTCPSSSPTGSRSPAP